MAWEKKSQILIGENYEKVSIVTDDRTDNNSLTACELDLEVRASQKLERRPGSGELARTKGYIDPVI